jgi:hypothetical protein
MQGTDGKIRIEYAGEIPQGLREHLSAICGCGVRVTEVRPLTLITSEPERVINQILPYLAENRMKVRRVEFRAARAS